MNILTLVLLFIIIILSAIVLYLFLRLANIKKEHSDNKHTQKDQFYEIVHELRAPLTAIKDASAMLTDINSKLTPGEQTNMLTMIKSECHRMLDQVSGFLDASKVMDNKLVVQKSPNNLKALLEEKIIMYTAQAKTANLSLVSDIDQNLPTMMYDPKYLSQVINNLISNSLKYTPAGGTITVSAKIADSNVLVSVFDNGLGIQDEKQKALFSKFAELNPGNVIVPSSGLGLYVVKGIIEAHGGKVEVETHQGRGYKISFTLPLQVVPASLAQTVQVSTQPTLKN